jgi:hypothetical protein
VNCPQLLDAGETVVRLRAVRNAAPPSASRAIAAPAPTTALDQSNPSSADELETSASPAVADRYAGFPGSTWCALWTLLGALGALDPWVIAFSDDWPEPPAGWLDCSDPPVIAFGYVYAAALAGIASEQAARTRAAARRALRRRRNMMVMV